MIETPTFDGLPDDIRELITYRKAHYHYRNGRKNNDGSLGTIDIGGLQLNEELAKMYKRGQDDRAQLP